MRVVSREDYREFVKSVPKIFDLDGKVLFRGRNIVKLFTFNGEPLVVKRYKIPIFIQRIVYTFFRKSKAERAYIYAKKLREKGFNTPKEIGFIEIKHHLLFRDGFFISELSYLPSLESLKEKEPLDTTVIDSLAKFLVSLHLSGVLHGDLNLSNILYEKTIEGEFAFTLIDTNRSRFSSEITKKDCIDNLKRITHDRSLMKDIIRHYAIIRGWNPDETAEMVIRRLDRFEKMRAFIKRDKNLYKGQ